MCSVVRWWRQTGLHRHAVTVALGWERQDNLRDLKNVCKWMITSEASLSLSKREL